MEKGWRDYRPGIYHAEIYDSTTRFNSLRVTELRPGDVVPGVGTVEWVEMIDGKVAVDYVGQPSRPPMAPTMEYLLVGRPH